jgi:hypothetical protein
MRDLFRSTLVSLSDHISSIADIRGCSETRRILLTGILAECPYCVHFIRDCIKQVSQNAVFLPTDDEYGYSVSFGSCRYLANTNRATFTSRGVVSRLRPCITPIKIRWNTEWQLKWDQYPDDSHRMSWLDEWESALSNSLGSWSSRDPVVDSVLRQLEIILLDRLRRESSMAFGVMKTALFIFSLASRFDRLDVKQRVGQAFSDAYSKERKLTWEADDPRKSLQSLHLMAAIGDYSEPNDFRALKVFLAGDFSFDGKILGPTSFEDYHTPLDVCAWYFDKFCPAREGVISILVRSQQSSILSASRIAARRGCENLLEIFSFRHRTFKEECPTLIYLAERGAHSSTVDWLRRKAGNPLSWQPSTFRDPVDGSFHHIAGFSLASFSGQPTIFSQALLHNPSEHQAMNGLGQGLGALDHLKSEFRLTTDEVFSTVALSSKEEDHTVWFGSLDGFAISWNWDTGDRHAIALGSSFCKTVVSLIPWNLVSFVIYSQALHSLAWTFLRGVKSQDIISACNSPI